MANAGDKNQNINTSLSKNNESNESTGDIISGYAKIDDFTKDGFKTLVEATKNSNSLPQDRDWDFYNTHESFKNLMSLEGNEILQMINGILRKQGIFGNIKNRDLEEKIELIIEANDVILERVANNIDELDGIRKNPQLPVEIQTVSAELPVSGSWNKINNAKITVGSSPSAPKTPNSIRLLTARNIQRPQKYFKDRIDNSKSPWEPRIKEKPNNLKPLAIYLEYSQDGQNEIFCHPYEFELERFEPSSDLLTKVTPKIPKPLSETPLQIIETEEQLNALVEDLRKYNEISVDLEHHSYRTYMGITCLLQISTGDTDYLIDTLILRDKLHILNEIFTKPTILKVFHGADMDILWLQRDLAIYVVNMFDTHQAAKQLSYPHLSLAYLLRRFCKIDADKHFQLADWRIRPLPDELKTYAREDTHYLLYIYHMMRNELLQQGENVLKAVIGSSTQVCKTRYEKPIINDNSHMDLYRRCKKLFDNRQMFALKQLYLWRDNLAREEDESTGFVLPNHMMLQIAELLPREMQGILACCNPIPPLVRANLLELHKIILKAREQSVTKPILSDDTRSRGSTQQATKINIDNIINCPHDLTKSEEFRDDLPTLLGNIINPKSNDLTSENTVLKIQNDKSTINIFETPENSDNENEIDITVKNKIKKLKFLSPYERYKLVKKYMLFEEDKQNENGKEKEAVEKKEVVEQKEAVEKKEENEKSNAERIAALQEHFKTMAAATNQIKSLSDSNTEIPEINKEITTLGSSSQKRKRSESLDEETKEPDTTLDTSSVLDTSNISNSNTDSTNQLETDKKKKKKNKQKKKANTNTEEVQSLNQVKKTEKKRTRANANKNKNPPPQNARYYGSNTNNKKQTHNESSQNQQKQNTNNRKRTHNESSQNQQQKQDSQNHSSNKKRKNNANQQNTQQNNRQQQNKNAKKQKANVQPFDYSAVDFQQFQGGAGSAHQPKNVGSNFKSKGSKNRKLQNIDRANVKSGTFRGNRGGRGAKRGRY